MIKSKLLFEKTPTLIHVRVLSPLERGGAYMGYRNDFLSTQYLMIYKYIIKSTLFYFEFLLCFQAVFFFFFFLGSGGMYCLSFSFSHSQIVIQYNKKKGYITILSTNECNTNHSMHSHINQIPNHSNE